MCKTCEKIDKVDAHKTSPVRLKCVDEKAARLFVELVGRCSIIAEVLDSDPDTVVMPWGGSPRFIQMVAMTADAFNFATEAEIKAMKRRATADRLGMTEDQVEDLTGAFGAFVDQIREYLGTTLVDSGD